MRFAGLEKEYASIGVLAAIHQKRFADYLDSLGSPGAARWDPETGEVMLRGHTLRAQLLASYDGRSWTWSWANSQLNLPDEKTAMARTIRDSVLQITGDAGTLIGDERVPFAIGALATAHAGADGYYIADGTEVYGIAPGQVPPSDGSVIDELRGAIHSMLSTSMPHDIPAGVRCVAERMKLDVDEEARHLVVREGRKSLQVAKSTLGPTKRTSVIFVPKSVSLADVLQRVKARSDVPVERLGDTFVVLDDTFEVHVTRSDKLGTIMSEANQLPTHIDDARRFGALFVVETAASKKYDGSLYAPAFGAWAPAQVSKGTPGSRALIGPAMVVQGALLDGVSDWLVHDCTLARVKQAR